MYSAWGTLTAIIAGGVTMTPGTDPDVFSITVAGNAVVPIDADLIVGDGTDATNGTVLTFQNCRAVDGSWSHDPTSKTATFQAMDFRWRWRWAEPLTGEYNRRDDSGAIVGTQKTAYELLELATANMTLPGGGTASIALSLAARLQAAYPYVNWENANAATEADTILSRYGGLICPRPSGNIVLCEMNVQAYDEPDVSPIAIDYGQSTVTAPATIRVQGARNLYQTTLTLTAVGYDPDDQTWKDLSATGASAISYKPDNTVTNGWHLGFEEGLTDKEAKQAARRTVFKAYRLPDTVTIGGVAYDREEAMRRWEPTIVETEFVDGEKRNREPYVLGAHYLMGTEGDRGSIDTDAGSVVPVEFSIDTQRGIIIFKEPVFTIDGANRSIGATLSLICAFRGARYVRDQTVTGGIAGLYDLVESESVYYRYVGATLTNQTDADTRAKQEADARASQYTTPVQSSVTKVYPGIINHSPDGVARQITWTVDQGNGPITTISWRREHVQTMPPLEARQREIELARLVRARRNQQRDDNV